MEHLYWVKVVDPVSGLQVQRSDLHSWDECEPAYFAYAEDYPEHYVLIVPAE